MKSYKAATTNKNVGSGTHGGFKNNGQKAGKKAVVRKEKAKSLDPVQAKLRKISKALFARTKSMNGDVGMRAQLNG